MPKNIDEWSSGQKKETLEVRIMSFLSQSSEKAFNLEEIQEGTGYKKQISLRDMDVRNEYWKALNHLREQGKVEAREFPPFDDYGTSYYKFVKKEDRL